MPPQTRIALLDLLRGAAILGMILYHTLYDLETFWGYAIGTDTTGWILFARLTAALFLLISGASVVIAEERLRATTHTTAMRWKKRSKRMLMIAAAAAAVSVATYVADPETYVRFGILHVIVVSRLLLPSLIRFGTWNIALGIAIVLVGITGPWTIDSSLFLSMGFIPPNFVTVDYFPLLPWLGVILAGTGLVSVASIRQWIASHDMQNPLGKFLRVCGRSSLTIYLIHQPILLLMLRMILGSPQK